MDELMGGWLDKERNDRWKDYVELDMDGRKREWIIKVKG